MFRDRREGAGLPDGASKIARVFRNGAAARQALENGAGVVVRVRQSRKLSQVNNTRVVAGQELQEHVTDILREDVVATNIKLTVKTCPGQTIHAEVDLIVKDTAYELKNWGTIVPSQVDQISSQIARQRNAIAAFNGTHGGLVISERTLISSETLEAFKDRGVGVLRAVDGELRVAVSTQ